MKQMFADHFRVLRARRFSALLSMLLILCGGGTMGSAFADEGPVMESFSFDYTENVVRLKFAWGADQLPDEPVSSEVQVAVDGGLWEAEIKSDLDRDFAATRGWSWFLEAVGGDLISAERTYEARVRWTFADGTATRWSVPMEVDGGPMMQSLSFNYAGKRERLELVWGSDQLPDEPVISEVQVSVEGGPWQDELESAPGIATTTGWTWFLEGAGGDWISDEREYKARVRWRYADDTMSRWSVPMTLSAAPTNRTGFAGLPFANGLVVASDYAEVPNAFEVWNFVFNGYTQSGRPPYDYRDDTQVVHYSAGGDQLPALDGTIYTGYRQLETHGPDSLWDADSDTSEQRNHTRSQLGGWSSTTSFHHSEQGYREFIAFSVRLELNPKIRGSVVDNTGLYWLSLISQFKSVTAEGDNDVTISVYEGYDGLQFVVREGDSRHYERVTDVARGQWLRIGLDIHWSKGDDGAYQWWVDTDGDSTLNFETLGEKRLTSIIRPDFDFAAFNIGPYHTLLTEDGDMESVQRHSRDYANIEILNHPITDPWR